MKSTKELLEFGIINIDKPSGPTSFNVSDFVRKILGIRKTSHFGTLDPKVTGVLPIALNRACKLTGYFIGHNKEYVGIMRMHEEIEMKKIQATINKKFLGKIKQTPPVKSRVARREREREIKSFELLEQDGTPKGVPRDVSKEMSTRGKDILFRAEVQGGTYIRKLIDDLGKELGIGAHMLELRRTCAGIFSEETSINLYDFEKAVKNKELDKIITPAEEAIKKVYPVMEIKKDNLNYILTGKSITKKDLVTRHRRTPKDFQRKSLLGAKVEEIVCCFCGKRFIGMYKIVDEEYAYAKPKFVMQPIKN